MCAKKTETVMDKELDQVAGGRSSWLEDIIVSSVADPRKEPTQPGFTPPLGANKGA
jgi:hypothetical protein